MEHFNGLTPAEAERLALLAEECGEVIQAIGKVLRHGYESMHPDGGPTNREALERECGDVYHAIWRVIGAGDIDGNGMSQRADDKAKSVGRYLHHQGHNACGEPGLTELGKGLKTLAGLGSTGLLGTNRSEDENRTT